MSKKKMRLITFSAGIIVGLLTWFSMGTGNVSLKNSHLYQAESGKFIEINNKELLFGNIGRSGITKRKYKNIEGDHYAIEEFNDESLNLEELGTVYFYKSDDLILFPLSKDESGEITGMEITEEYHLVHKEDKNE